MYRVIKRAMDIALAGAALLVLSPLLFPVCLGLLITGEHDVFYLQRRVGLHNRMFKVWKFATMMKGSSKMAGGFHTTRADARVLPLGHLLRKTKVNELPQLFNVLRGEMSIVGPRPLVAKTFDPYPEHVKSVIYDVRPGLTGIGSIIFRDEERLLSESGKPLEQFYAQHISPAKGELELWYQRHLCFWTDIMIIFLTAWVIAFPKSQLVHAVFKNLPAIEVPGLGSGAVKSAERRSAEENSSPRVLEPQDIDISVIS